MLRSAARDRIRSLLAAPHHTRRRWGSLGFSPVARLDPAPSSPSPPWYADLTPPASESPIRAPVSLEPSSRRTRRDLTNVVSCLCLLQPLRLEIKVRPPDLTGSRSPRRRCIVRAGSCRFDFALISVSFCFLVVISGSSRNGQRGSSRWIFTPRSHGEFRFRF